MIEGKRVVAGEAILSGITTTERRHAEVLEALVRDHSRLVYRITYSVLRSHHDAEDATQETFMRVLRYSAKLDSVEEPKTWLARIAWRVAVDRAKQRKGTRELSLDDEENSVPDPASTDPAPDQAVESRQMEAAVQKLIAALPGKLRDPLLLSAAAEMSPREVGAILGINEAAVRSRVFRARQILKERMAQLIPAPRR